MNLLILFTKFKLFQLTVYLSMSRFVLGGSVCQLYSACATGSNRIKVAHHCICSTSRQWQLWLLSEEDTCESIFSKLLQWNNFLTGMAPKKSIYFVTVISTMVPDTWDWWWVFTKIAFFDYYLWLDIVLSNLMYFTSPWAGLLTRWDLEVHFNPNTSLILQFCYYYLLW